jgi:RNA polymerase-binding transcription factor DksA
MASDMHVAIAHATVGGHQMEIAKRKISTRSLSIDSRYRKFRVKVQMEELALLLTIQKAEDHLRRLNGDGYLSGGETGIDDEREAWAVRTNFYMRRLKLVRESLDRIRSGEYGICASCNQEIATKRLNAVPTAIYCLDCQQQVERQTAGRTVPV